jgi:triacylglycerol lipase
MGKKPRTDAARRHVVVLHGLAMNRLFMSGIAAHLERQGFAAHNVSYPSRAKSFESLVDEHLAPLVEGIDAPAVDFVAHSMGGLLVRLYAQKYGAAKIGRVVMIGTPNRGSEVADFIRRWQAFHWYFGAAGESLCTGNAGLHAALPPVPFECGVIAGDNHWLHVTTNFIVDVPRPHDGIVSVESTKVEGMKDHVTVFADHSLMVWSPRVWKLAAQFLDKGSFSGAE